MSAPVQGWYPDPGGEVGERWWDGRQWSGHTRPYPPPAAVPHPDDPQAPAHGWDGWGRPAPAPTVVDDPVHHGVRYDGAPAAGGRGGPGGVVPGNVVARNGFSLAALVAVVVYAALLVVAHVALFGVLPVVLSARAVGRREPLRWVALLVSLLAAAVTVYRVSR